MPNDNARPSRPEIVPLTGVRAFAALWVVLFHAQGLIPASWGLLNWFAHLGALGVNLFFVLSGFIISFNYWQQFSSFTVQRYRSFLWFRLARIYPVHLFTLIGSLVLLVGVRAAHLSTAKDFSHFTVTTFAANLFLVHAWVPQPVVSWNNPSWSISAEWFAYLLFPLLAALKLRKVRLLFISLLGMVVIPALPAFVHQTVPAPPFLYLIRVVCGFTAGSLTYLVFVRWQMIVHFGKTLVCSAAAAFLAILALEWHFNSAVDPEWILSPEWIAVAFPLAILALASSKGIVAYLFSTKPAVYWGRVSYSLYMTHAMTLWVLKAVIPLRPVAPSILQVVIYVASIGIVASLTYHFVEEPARLWMRRLSLPAPKLASGHDPA